MVFQTARLVYEDRPDLETKDVMTIAEAARALGVTVQAVAQSLDRGAMTIALDTKTPLTDEEANAIAHKVRRARRG